MKFRKFLLVLLFYTLTFTNSYSIEPDVFVQSTVNRASNILSKNISKEDKINELKVIGTKTSLDGQALPLFMFSIDQAKQIKLNYAFPSQFAVSADLFSNTLTKFDSGVLTFDDSTA